MNIWELPPVRQAAQTILLEARFLRLEHPEMTPLERIQEARARCVPEVLAALGSIIRAEEMAKNGPWVLQGGRQRRSKPRPVKYTMSAARLPGESTTAAVSSKQATTTAAACSFRPAEDSSGSCGAGPRCARVSGSTYPAATC